MVNVLDTEAEKQAELAESFPAFSGLKLLHVKRQLDILLSLIGGNGIFDEYTRHDISHIDAMLRSLDWLIPDDTKKLMTPADWLAAVLGIYFHDLGMLVTREEYDARSSTGFGAFVKETLFVGSDGEDYRARVNSLLPERRDRFLYQEFVRYHHAERVKWWIIGQAPIHLGHTHAAMVEVDRLLQTLDQQFRRDLALVCESHHKDDLGEFDRYKTSRPYGQSARETANLHFACILLRCADLLHVTGDRTPSLAFRVINPADPLSQEEWAKQMAVKNVRSQVGRDREGNLDLEAPRDTIEVSAYFVKEGGFFGLTSYLAYARRELRKCYDWMQAANQTRGVLLRFPWRHLDDSNIETENFVPKPFEFSLDQARILDLLTGHTLYNDTSVVLRELIQNAIDAVRVQRLGDQASGASAVPGGVSVTWDSANRLLTVSGAGTGMTQATVEAHLLKVGASLYQEPEFRKAHPSFSPISRFGIGILSTFMVADSVDITTCHPGEEKARRLSLRSVHGKYLVRLLRKDDPEVSGIFPHGTRIEVTVRPSARVDDVLETVRKWVVVPACPITTTIDGGTTVRVGYGGPGEYLRRALEQRGFKVVERASPSEAAVCVNEERVGDMSLAYALSWSETFREWAFLAADQNPKSDKYITLGTCVEGIRVEFGTPGFAGMSIVAIANAVGKTAPKTNVARSGLENTPERASLMSGVYAVYCRHIAGELAALQQRGFSPTWAAQEAEYLVPPLLSQSPIEPGALDQALDDLPAVATEGPQGRTLETLKRIRTLETFWTTEWPLAKTAEWLITESQGSAGLAALLEALGYSAAPLPSGTRVCSASRRSHLSAKAFADRGIKAIACFPELRRVDITWGDERDGEWIRVSGPVAKCVQVVTRGIGGPSLDRNYHIPKAPVSPGVTPAGSAIVISNEVVLLRGTLAEKCSLLVSALDRDAAPNGLPSSASDLALLLALHAIGLTPGFRNQNRDIGPIFQHIHREVNSYGYKPSAASGIELIPLIQEAWDSSYDPYAGSRLPVMAF